MIEDNEPVEMDEVRIVVDTMPMAVFEELWAGLVTAEAEFGDPSGSIQQAKNWLNITMQGGEWDALCDWMGANAPEPEPPDPEPPDDWNDEIEDDD